MPVNHQNTKDPESDTERRDLNTDLLKHHIDSHQLPSIMMADQQVSKYIDKYYLTAVKHDIHLLSFGLI